MLLPNFLGGDEVSPFGKGPVLYTSQKNKKKLIWKLVSQCRMSSSSYVLVQMRRWSEGVGKVPFLVDLIISHKNIIFSSLSIRGQQKVVFLIDLSIHIEQKKKKKNMFSPNLPSMWLQGVSKMFFSRSKHFIPKQNKCVPGERRSFPKDTYIVERDCKWSQKQKIFSFAAKLSLHNMAASSGLRENVYPSNFFSNVHIYNIIIFNE